MPTESEIREQFQSWGQSLSSDCSILAQVKSVDEQNSTCILVDDDELEYFDVRLRPIVGVNKSYLPIPKTESFVLAVRIENTDEWMVIACEEVEKIHLIVGNTTIVMTEDSLVFNDGKLGGLVISQQVVNELVKIIVKLDAVVTAMQSVATSFNAQNAAPLTGTTAGSIISSAFLPITPPLVQPVATVLENRNIKH